MDRPGEGHRGRTWNGSSYLVVWQDGRNGAEDDVYGARVSREGVVQDADGFPISIAAGHQSIPAVAWNGSSHLVVWQDGRRALSLVDGDVYGARVSGEGVVLDADGIPVSTAAVRKRTPAVAWNGSSYLVVWSESDGSGTRYDITGARVTGEGVVLDATGILVSSSASLQGSPAVAWGGSSHLVVWERAGSGGPNVYGARVSGDGVVLDADGIRISTAAGASPALAWDGSSHLVVWDAGDIHGGRVTADGAVLDAAGILVSQGANVQHAPAAAWGGSSYLVVWQDSRRSGTGLEYDVYGARVSRDGVVLDTAGIPISTASRDQAAPRVAWDGIGYLVVWADFRSGLTWDVYGARVSAEGVVLDADGIAIATFLTREAAPAVASDGSSSLVVWQEDSGAPLSGPYPIYYRILGARVSRAGVVQDGIPISIATSSESSSYLPAVAWGQASYLVVWEDVSYIRSNTQPQVGERTIRGARVSGEGVVLDAPAIRISTWSGSPAVSWNGSSHLVVSSGFVVWDGSEQRLDITGARVSGEGAVLDAAGIRISTATGNQLVPAVAWDGSSCLVVWQDQRGGKDFDIYGARVSVEGAVQDPDGILLAHSGDDELTPAVASSGQSRSLLVYERFDADPAVRSPRVRARMLDLPPEPTASGCACGSGTASVPLGALLLGIVLLGHRRGASRACGGRATIE